MACSAAPQMKMSGSLLLSRSVVSSSFASPWAAARQASLSFTLSQNSLKRMSMESVMPSSHLILCRPLLLLPSIFPTIRVFSNESALHIKWPEDWSFSFIISPSNEYWGLICQYENGNGLNTWLVSEIQIKTTANYLFPSILKIDHKLYSVSCNKSQWKNMETIHLHR